MNKLASRVAWAVAAVLWTGVLPSIASANGTIKIDDAKSVTVGAGLRTEFRAVSHSAPNGTDASKNFSVPNARLYVSGTLNDHWSLAYNMEKNAAGAVNVLDAILKYHYCDYVNIWAGQTHPAQDRDGISGPYYLGTWDFPFVSLYPSIIAGRDQGINLWGQVKGGMFKYTIGSFQGQTGPQNLSRELLYAGRVTINLLDPEPGFYHDSTYYGEKDIAAIGIAGQTQKNFATTALSDGNYNAYNLDLLLEKKIPGMGAPTLETAFYRYNLDNAPTTLGVTQGQGYFVLAGYNIPNMGKGILRPLIRYQNFLSDSGGPSGTFHERTEFGFTYILDGDNARVSAIYYRDNNALTGVSNIDGFVLGLQLQI